MQLIVIMINIKKKVFKYSNYLSMAGYGVPDSMFYQNVKNGGGLPRVCVAVHMVVFNKCEDFLALLMASNFAVKYKFLVPVSHVQH